jgi:hypothetical protein
MGMILERAAPSVEHAEEATTGAADVFGVRRQFPDSGAGRSAVCTP